MTLFELKNCVDLFKKAKHDFARLDELASLYDLSTWSVRLITFQNGSEKTNEGCYQNSLGEMRIGLPRAMRWKR